MFDSFSTRVEGEKLLSTERTERMQRLISRPNRLLLLPYIFLTFNLSTTFLNLRQQFCSITAYFLLDLRLFINAQRLYLPF